MAFQNFEPSSQWFIIRLNIVSILCGVLWDLHCNPVQVAVSGKVLFVPGGGKQTSFRDLVSWGCWGIRHSVLFRTDVILSSSSLGCLSWQLKKACSKPLVPTAPHSKSLLSSILKQNRLTFNHVICHRQPTKGERSGHYHIDESWSCRSRLPDGRVCVAKNMAQTL